LAYERPEFPATWRGCTVRPGVLHVDGPQEGSLGDADVTDLLVGATKWAFGQVERT